MKRSRAAALPAGPLAGPSTLHLLTRDVLEVIVRHLSIADAARFLSASKVLRNASANMGFFGRINDVLFAWPLPSPTTSEQQQLRDRFATQLSLARSQHETRPVHTVRRVTLAGAACAVRCVALSPDGSRAFAGESRGTGVISFELPSGRDVAPLPQLQRYTVGEKTGINVTALLCASSQHLFVGSSRPVTRAQLYDVQSASLLQEYAQHKDSVFCLATTASHIVSGGG